MKLIPKAKPVKIRIKSGGEEHSSLDSLKRNFNIKDIVPLLDGRLTRWLRQQGEYELALSLDGITASSLESIQEVMNLMTIFFKEYLEEHNIKNLLELATCWLKSDIYRKDGENLFLYITWDMSCYRTEGSLDIIKYLYNHRDELKCPRTDWFTIFGYFWLDDEDSKETDDAEVQFIVGKMLWEGYQFNDLYVNDHHTGDKRGLELIQKSAEAGYQEANLFIFNYNISQKTNAEVTKRFAGIDRNKIRIWINDNWDNYGKDVKYSNTDYVNEKEKDILNFVCQCYFLKSNCSNRSWKETLQKAQTFWGENPNDFLKKEKKFILGLLYKIIGWSSKADENFTDIRDYPPARYMLSFDQLIDNTNLRAMTFPSQVSFVIRYLFDYE